MVWNHLCFFVTEVTKIADMLRLLPPRVWEGNDAFHQRRVKTQIFFFFLIIQVPGSWLGAPAGWIWVPSSLLSLPPFSPTPGEVQEGGGWSTLLGIKELKGTFFLHMPNKGLICFSKTSIFPRYECASERQRELQKKVAVAVSFWIEISHSPKCEKGQN